jgi:aldehyde dehydrogenase (NAD+)
MYLSQKVFISGRWQTSANKNELIDVINPANGKIIAKTASANELDVNNAIKAAKVAFESWSQTSSAQRKKWIHSVADEMQNRVDDLCKVISESMGCPLKLTREIQVQSAINAFREFAEMTEFVEETLEKDNVIQCHVPVGVCVLINPWNYPLSQLMGKLGPAMATGCTVVAKPSEQTPLQDLIIAEIFEKVGVPDGVFNVITGYGAHIGSYLCSHPDVDMVSFTGSTSAGVKVAQAASTSIKRVCQELGGKSPFIITEGADLNKAIRYGVEDVMLNSGQTCNALTRILVPESLYSKAVNLSKSIAEEFIIGDPTNPLTTMGPLSSKQQQQRVIDYIKLGLKEGATLITGGYNLPSQLEHGAFVLPTIFANVNNNMRIAQEEIFGPVLCLIPYKNEKEAIEIANNTVYGLSSAVFASDANSALKLARRIRAGQCYIQGSYFTTKAPFGGFKQSGNGREWGREGLKEFIELQSLIL